MRIRYGKQVKVTSLLGSCNTPFSYTSSNTAWAWFIQGGQVNNKTGSSPEFTFSNTANYKYFALVKSSVPNVNGFDCNASGSTLDNSYIDAENQTYCCVIHWTESSSQRVLRGAFLNNNNRIKATSGTNEYGILIDLTTAGIDTLTAQQVYKLLKGNLELLAAGGTFVTDFGGRINGGGSNPLLLPPEYQQVEWIKGDGSSSTGAYIDTGVVIGTSFGLKMKYKLDNTSNDQKFFGSYDSIGWGIGTLNSKYRNLLNWSLLDYTTSTNVVELETAENGAKVNFTENGTTTQLNFTAAKANASNRTAYLLACHYSNDSVGGKSSMYLYSCDIMINNEWVRKFIPCYRISDNVIGLYDLINDTFYTNAHTAGSFTKGPNVYREVQMNIAGGVSETMYGYNMLCPTFAYWTKTGNVEITASEDGRKLTFANTSNANWTYNNLLFNQTVPSGHKVLVTMTVTNPNAIAFNYRLRTASAVSYDGNSYSQIFTTTGDIDRLQFYGASGVNYTGVIVENIQVIDLTQWFGVGKEPATVAAFQTQFPGPYYGTCQTAVRATIYEIEEPPKYGYNQICKYGNFESTTGWSTSYTTLSGYFTVSNNKMTISANVGQTTGDFDNIQTSVSAYPNHVLLTMCYLKSNTTGQVCTTAYNTTQLSIQGYTTAGSRQLIYQFCRTNNVDNHTRYPQFRPYAKNYTIQSGDYCEVDHFMVIDLTDWFGAGNEPTTMAGFQALFPNEYYPYPGGDTQALLSRAIINKLK